MLWLLQSRIQSTLPLREREVSEKSNLCELTRAPEWTKCAAHELIP
jgi:hypothetical protein